MKLKVIGLAAIFTLALVGAFWGVAGAQSFRSGNKAKVASGEVVDSALWAAGNTVEIAGEVNGDVFCAGMTVTVSGTVRGDVLCAAQSITVTGTVEGDMRLAGQSVTVGASGVRDLTVAAQSFVQEDRSTVQRDASVAAADISMSGSVGRDAAVVAQDISLGGQIGRDVKATVNQLRLGNNASVGGDLSYTSQNDVQITNGATVAGETTKSLPQERDGRDAGVPVFRMTLGFALYLFAAGLLVALVLVLLFPQAIHAVAGQAIRSPLKTLLVGFIAALAVPALILLLMITVIGIPLALILLVAWILLQALAGVAAAYYLGRLVWRGQRNPILIMLAGAVLLLVLYFLPFIGFFALLAAMLFGTGMILLELNRRRAKPRYQV